MSAVSGWSGRCRWASWPGGPGCPKQTLSKIEQGSGNPTVETLSLLGTALDIPARRLLAEWGTPVHVQRRDEGGWSDSGAWSEQVLDEVYGSGYVRTLVLRLERAPEPPEPVAPHAAGTLHHLYVITGKLRTGPLTEQADLAAGDFARFPGDVPHRHLCLTDHAVAHMVTTLPQVRRMSPTVLRGAHRHDPTDDAPEAPHMTPDAIDRPADCLACGLLTGRTPLPGGTLLRTTSWTVEHCVGPLGLGTLVVKPLRHVLHLAALTPPESAELGPLLQRVSAAVTSVMAPDQVYVCLWSHAGGRPGHLHFVVQPVDRATLTRFDAFGPALQVAMGAAGRFPDPSDVARVCAGLRQALAVPAPLPRQKPVDGVPLASDT
ncbi:hypothetical protein ACFXAZ_34705 [Streptomyces sp. NPDC059477]|uniref:hypothetical protein n=1 Tax=Streptomyces sp. NPDC059477 TaxID=3346847 RepID=UPI0036A75045